MVFCFHDQSPSPISCLAPHTSFLYPFLDTFDILLTFLIASSLIDHHSLVTSCSILGSIRYSISNLLPLKQTLRIQGAILQSMAKTRTERAISKQFIILESCKYLNRCIKTQFLAPINKYPHFTIIKIHICGFTNRITNAMKSRG